MTRNAGSPHCSFCNGTGGHFSNSAWRKCRCVAGTREQRELDKYASGFTAQHPKGDAVRQALRERGKH